jgi:hypothetical protein
MKKLLILIAANCFAIARAQWSANTTLNTEAAALKSADIQTIGTSNGGTWIAWFHENAGNYDMRAQLIDAQGNKLLGSNGVLVSNQTSGSAIFVFNVAIDNANNLIIGFSDQRTGSNTVVGHKVSPAGSLLWGSSGIVLGGGLAPYPAVLSNNEVVFAWTDNANVFNYQKINTSGSAVWSPAKTLAPSVAGRTLTRGQVVAHTNGFGIIYQERSVGISSTLWMQRFDNSGTALWSNAVQLSPLVTAATRYYSVLSDGDITYAGIFANPSGQNRFDAIVQRINADGSLPWGSSGSDVSTDASASYELGCKIAYKPGSAQLWAVSNTSNTSQSQYGIIVQKFNAATGARLFADLGKTVYAISATSPRDQGFSLCDDVPLIYFAEADNKLFVAGLNNSGDFAWATPKTEIGSTTASKNRYGFTKVVNNQAVAVWQENKGTEERPYAQNIGCNGATGPGVFTAVTALATGSNWRIELLPAGRNAIRLLSNRAFGKPLLVQFFGADGRLLLQERWAKAEAGGSQLLQLPQQLTPQVLLVRITGEGMRAGVKYFVQ